ncbi:hypothetical protein PFICI_09410 [Pestalotiopsis fici W106-1]|uniref:Heterokaryon incompatibility domain-containing protein n=1 Tax=Pestalotiopsis fici (strain W106-1 / CGMCC3.15140) TaxID=1229662 RepID=W3X2D7_PESFW|nr:uncharacterized protein PFICI_09410 [Pestalotiopsis fici W106-1]ETS79557.1 hypothetical protein PFICI_09410 [Pestalotiopsis fici W106-1]
MYNNIFTATWSLLQLLYIVAPPNTLDVCIVLAGLGIRLLLWSASQTDIVTKVFLEALNNLHEDTLSEAILLNNSVYQSLPALEHGGGYMQGRLLELQPGSGNEPIVCTLGIMELGHSDGKPYEALSYVWGTSPWTSRVQVNGKNFVISITLHRLLLHLRRESTPRALWIDALCINQSDLAERSSQVLLMPIIYSNATQAIVWLGHHEPLGLEKTFQYMNLPSQNGAKNDRVNNRIHYGSSRVAAQLLRNDYWTRTWVIQEVVLAKSAVVQCGNSALAWDRFCRLAHASTQHSFFPVKSTHFDKFEDLNDIRTSRLSLQNDSNTAPRKSRCLRATMTRPENSMDLLSLCYRFRFRKSTDPRDKVFAFLGLSDVSKRLLNVDYCRRQSFLCIELSMRHMCHSRSLSVVALAESMRAESKLDNPAVGKPDYIPTWCPSFFRSDGWFDDNLRLLWTGLPSDETSFSATGCTPTSIAPEYESSQEETADNHSSFHLLKVHVLPEFSAKITHDGRFDDPNDEALSKTFRIDETLHATLRSISGQILPAERTLSKEAVRLRKSTDAHRTSHHPAALLDQDMSADELLHLTLTAGKFSKFPTAVANPSRGQYHQARRHVYSGRRLFVTGNGHLGLGPEGLRNGGELHLVLGMDVPVILRPALSEWEHLGTPYKSAWVYVGQAYVHEMMRYKGDLVEDIRRSKVKLEERVLV